MFIVITSSLQYTYISSRGSYFFLPPLKKNSQFLS